MMMQRPRAATTASVTSSAATCCSSPPLSSDGVNLDELFHDAPLPPVKRRSASLSDQFPVHHKPQTARNAVASAMANVSKYVASSGKSRAEKFAKFRSSSDQFMKLAPSTWKLPGMGIMKGGAGRARARTRAAQFGWMGDEDVHSVSAVHKLHGEDFGAVTPYYHIVADGVSSPFSKQAVPKGVAQVSSDVIAAELVDAVRKGLEDMTNHNAVPLDPVAFESVVVSAIKATRIKCFPHRHSRIATTLLVSYFDRWNGKLLTFSLGDSKCIVIRDGEIVYETLAVLHEFNVPCVVNLTSQITSADYVVQSFDLQAKDICLTVSDGMSDNLYKHEILRTLQEITDDPDCGLDLLQQGCDRLVAQCQGDHAPKGFHKAPRQHENEDHSDANAPSVSPLPLEPLDPLLVNSEIVFVPFATAAALEYRARSMREFSKSSMGDKDRVDHLASSLPLYERHQTKAMLDRHVLRNKPNRKRHYSLAQLKRMAEMQIKKPDDITVLLSRFG